MSFVNCLWLISYIDLFHSVFWWCHTNLRNWPKIPKPQHKLIGDISAFSGIICKYLTCTEYDFLSHTLYDLLSLWIPIITSSNCFVKLKIRHWKGQAAAKCLNFSHDTWSWFKKWECVKTNFSPSITLKEVVLTIADIRIQIKPS